MHLQTVPAYMPSLYPQLWCADGEFSVWGRTFMTPLAQALRLITHFGEPQPHVKAHEFTSQQLLLFCGTLFVLMTLTFGIGAPTGGWYVAL